MSPLERTMLDTSILKVSESQMQFEHAASPDNRSLEGPILVNMETSENQIRLVSPCFEV